MDAMEKAIIDYSKCKKSFRVKLNEIRNSDILNDYQKEVQEDEHFKALMISNERREFYYQHDKAKGNAELEIRFGGLCGKYFPN